MKKRKLTIVCFSLLWIALLLTSGRGETTVKDVEQEIMCMCKDNCGKVLANCICQYSQQYRMDISLKLNEGLTKEQVIQTYVDKYGEKVLSAPTKKGFNLTAWLTPFVVIMLGGMGIRRVVVKWVALRKKEAKGKGSDHHRSKLENTKYSNLLEKELKEFD